MGDATIRVATDVGGTFTDLVCFEHGSADGEYRITTAKTDTTPPAFERGVIDVIAKAGIDPAAISLMVHGSTVVINAITERRGVRVGLITTEGFRDTLEIARGNRPDFFNLHYRKPPPFVPRALRRELPGRMDYRGHELTPFDHSSLCGILDDFRREGVDAIAICFLHSYANPAHELAARRAIRDLWPEVSITVSHEINREWREYERTSTTVLSAYVQPIAERYLAGLDDRLRERGFAGGLFVMQSNGGVDSLDAASRIPITMVESGPASGMWGAAEVGKLIGEPNVLALDIGGTTAKCALIERGNIPIKTDYWIERDRTSSGYPVMVPVVDLVEIGNGGGSIAWVDDFDKLHVGPRSAGAAPGPAAYGRGGMDATTTDANLWLRRINPDYFCGGALTADMAACEQALTRLGDRLGLGPTDTARGIVRIANNNMVNALKLVSIDRGFDPRDFTLITFGGGGGLHGVALGAELGVRKVVVPAAAAVFSAWGMMMSDLRRDYFVTHPIEFGPGAATALTELLDRVEAEARAQFARDWQDAGMLAIRRAARLRYAGQGHVIEVPIADAPLAADRLAALEQDFHRVYEQDYGYRLAAPVEMVGLHLVAAADIGKMPMVARKAMGEPAATALKGERMVDYAEQGIHLASLYDGARLSPGMHFVGPAIIEDSGTTVVIHPGNRVEIDGYRNIHISLIPASLGENR